MEEQRKCLKNDEVSSSVEAGGSFYPSLNKIVKKTEGVKIVSIVVKMFLVPTLLESWQRTWQSNPMNARADVHVEIYLDDYGIPLSIREQDSAVLFGDQNESGLSTDVLGTLINRRPADGVLRAYTGPRQTPSERNPKLFIKFYFDKDNGFEGLLFEANGLLNGNPRYIERLSIKIGVVKNGEVKYVSYKPNSKRNSVYEHIATTFSTDDKTGEFCQD
jgi:hypothetical protein